MIDLKSLFLAVIFIGLISSAASASGSSPQLAINITSSKTLDGTAGDYATVEGTLTNTGNGTLADIVTYLSLVDDVTKLPVDLEDWSAEKGLYIGTIEAGQTLPLNWKIHFVKAGNYSLIIVAEAAGNELPQVSSITRFNVASKINLNPGEVLPVAFGTPVILIVLLFLLSSKRRVDD
jgi:hypothetical protein